MVEKWHGEGLRSEPRGADAWTGLRRMSGEADLYMYLVLSIGIFVALSHPPHAYWKKSSHGSAVGSVRFAAHDGTSVEERSVFIIAAPIAGW